MSNDNKEYEDAIEELTKSYVMATLAGISVLMEIQWQSV
jgi:hypothetical protein